MRNAACGVGENMEGFHSNFKVSQLWSYTIKNMPQSIYYPLQTKKKKMDPSSSDLCWNGCGQVGTLFHMLWHCPAVKTLWKQVVHSLSITINTEILTCLLGYRTAQLRLKKDRKTAGLAFLAAKR